MDAKEAQKILDIVEEKEAKVRITVSIDPRVLDRFKKAIGSRPISTVVEQLLRNWIEAYKATHLTAAEPPLETKKKSKP